MAAWNTNALLVLRTQLLDCLSDGIEQEILDNWASVAQARHVRGQAGKKDAFTVSYVCGVALAAKARFHLVLAESRDRRHRSSKSSANQDRSRLFCVEAAGASDLNCMLRCSMSTEAASGISTTLPNEVTMASNAHLPCKGERVGNHECALEGSRGRTWRQFGRSVSKAVCEISMESGTVFVCSEVGEKIQVARVAVLFCRAASAATVRPLLLIEKRGALFTSWV